jgi:hypothetical protein
MRPSRLLVLLFAAVLVACGSTGGGSDATGADGATPDPSAADTLPGDAADVPGPGDAAESDGATPDAALCIEGAPSCSDDHLWQLTCQGGEWARLKPCAAGTLCLGKTCAPSEPCTPGAPSDCPGLATASVCDDSGLGFVPVDCPAGQYCVSGACTTTTCIPGQPVCADTTHSAFCLPDGSGPGPATACDDVELCVGGLCRFTCGDDLKYAGSSVGCRFWSVDLGQWNVLPGEMGLDPSASGIPHAVIIANPNDVAATISFRTGDDSPVVVDNPVVGPGETRSFLMPVMSLQESAVTRKSIRVLSTRPVVAAQFNPPNNEDFVHTSDASLLYPQEVLGKLHVVISGESLNVGTLGGMKMPVKYGYFTVVAVNPGTTSVTFAPSCPTQAGPAFDAIPEGQVTVVDLQQWEVLTVQAWAPVLSLTEPGYNLTGTVIESTQSVAVFGGNDCLNVGQGNCDHVETQLLPVEAWGREYVAVHMQIPSPNLYRVTAYHDGTTLHTDPVVPELDGKTLDRGDWVDASSMTNFVISSELPFQVATFIEGYDPGGTSYSGTLVDPSMAAMIPTDQYRQDYPLLVPTAYAENYVTVARPKGAALLLDYQPYNGSSFSAVGSSAWEATNIPLGEGVHRIEGAAPFGVIAFGADSKVSYAYPAGANITLSTTP